MGGVDGNPDKHNPSSSSPYIRYPEKDEEDPNILNILLASFVGATVTTFLVCNLRRTADLFLSRLSRSLSGKTGRSFRSTFQEEAWRRYTRRMQEMHEEEMERVERIRRMQSVFNRERNKYARDYESWRENGAGPGPDTYHQHFQRDDWYWKTDTSHRRTNYWETPRASASSLSQHYSVLGLDRSRKTPYTEAEIKTAFRTKAKEFHPDQNQKNKDAAEAKFKEVMTSYEAIKQERKDIKF